MKIEEEEMLREGPDHAFSPHEYFGRPGLAPPQGCTCCFPLKSSLFLLPSLQLCGPQNFQLGVTRQGAEGRVERVIYL